MAYADPWPSRQAQYLASIKRAGKVFDEVKPWRAPRLSADGKPFAPALGEVGSWVAWAEYEPVRSLSGIPTGERREVEHVGQVWCLTSSHREVIVVDLEQREHRMRIADLRPAAVPGEQLALA